MKIENRANHFRITGPLILLVVAMAIFALLWLDGRPRETISNSISGEPEKVVQCLHSDDDSFLGEIKNTVYEEDRECHSMAYHIPKDIDYVLVPSYGITRQSLQITFPRQSKISDRLYRIHGVRSTVYIQIRPSDFDAQHASKIESSREGGYLEPSTVDEHFLVWKIGNDSRTYYSIQDDHPFLISCTMRNRRSDGPSEYLLCEVWTRTCNGLAMTYTTFGHPFENLESVNTIHQELVRPLFDRCD